MCDIATISVLLHVDRVDRVKRPTLRMHNKNLAADLGGAVRELNKTLRTAAWSKMQDILDAYPSATVLNSERVVFHVKGNDYRAVVAFDFQRQRAFVKFVGTHGEYDRVDALTVSQR